jgi:hypothetical protein
MKLNTKLYSAQPNLKTRLKTKRKSSDDSTNSEIEYTYDRIQDDQEVKQQFSLYLEQDVYFN